MIDIQQKLAVQHDAEIDHRNRRQGQRMCKCRRTVLVELKWSCVCVEALFRGLTSPGVDAHKGVDHAGAGGLIGDLLDYERAPDGSRSTQQLRPRRRGFRYDRVYPNPVRIPSAWLTPGVRHGSDDLRDSFFSGP